MIEMYGVFCYGPLIYLMKKRNYCINFLWYDYLVSINIAIFTIWKNEVIKMEDLSYQELRKRCMDLGLKPCGRVKKNKLIQMLKEYELSSEWEKDIYQYDYSFYEAILPYVKDMPDFRPKEVIERMKERPDLWIEEKQNNWRLIVEELDAVTANKENFSLLEAINSGDINQIKNYSDEKDLLAEFFLSYPALTWLMMHVAPEETIIPLLISQGLYLEEIEMKEEYIPFISDEKTAEELVKNNPSLLQSMKENIRRNIDRMVHAETYEYPDRNRVKEMFYERYGYHFQAYSGPDDHRRFARLYRYVQTGGDADSLENEPQSLGMGYWLLHIRLDSEYNQCIFYKFFLTNAIYHGIVEIVDILMNEERSCMNETLLYDVISTLEFKEELEKKMSNSKKRKDYARILQIIINDEFFNPVSLHKTLLKKSMVKYGFNKEILDYMKHPDANANKLGESFTFDAARYGNHELLEYLLKAPVRR